MSTVEESPVIRTPDQRIRVFVSSTLRELAAERSAVRAAIEAMNLAPVMFELGARPHPPRDLYRSYLAQSDVFVGIYADSYGWVAPGEELSGLEDEYNLASDGMPKPLGGFVGGRRCQFNKRIECGRSGHIDDYRKSDERSIMGIERKVAPSSRLRQRVR